MSENHDAKAAEFALGTLPKDERAAVDAELRRDPELASRVLDWETRLSPLGAGIPAVEPSADAFAGIAERAVSTKHRLPDSMTLRADEGDWFAVSARRRGKAALARS